MLILPPVGKGPPTSDLILFQVDGLQGSDSSQGLREMPKPVAGEVDGPEVQQGSDFLRQAVQVVARQVELLVWGTGERGEEGERGWKNN